MSRRTTQSSSKLSSTSPTSVSMNKSTGYARGIKSYIWSELCTTDYNSLEALMRGAERVESAMGTRLNPSRSATNTFRSGPMPMELNTTATVQKLTPEEREKCMRESLCLRCRAKGHMARECPKTLKRNYSVLQSPLD
jgi:hypothetical protein